MPENNEYGGRTPKEVIDLVYFPTPEKGTSLTIDDFFEKFSIENTSQLGIFLNRLLMDNVQIIVKESDSVVYTIYKQPEVSIQILSITDFSRFRELFEKLCSLVSESPWLLQRINVYNIFLEATPGDFARPEAYLKRRYLEIYECPFSVDIIASDEMGGCVEIRNFRNHKGSALESPDEYHITRRSKNDVLDFLYERSNTNPLILELPIVRYGVIPNHDEMTVYAVQMRTLKEIRKYDPATIATLEVQRRSHLSELNSLFRIKESFGQENKMIKEVSPGHILGLILAIKACVHSYGITTIRIPLFYPLRTHYKKLEKDADIYKQNLSLALRIEYEMDGSIEIVPTSIEEGVVHILVHPPLRAKRSFIQKIFDQIDTEC